LELRRAAQAERVRAAAEEQRLRQTIETLQNQLKPALPSPEPTPPEPELNYQKEFQRFLAQSGIELFSAEQVLSAVRPGTRSIGRINEQDFPERALWPNIVPTLKILQQRGQSP
jgi:hypothetical protein